MYPKWADGAPEFIQKEESGAQSVAVPILSVRTRCQVQPLIDMSGVSALGKDAFNRVLVDYHVDAIVEHTQLDAIGRHYKIIEQIGEGGMSRVYRALHLLLDRPVAIKYIKPGFVNDQRSVMRFQQEARAAAALKHPNICAVNEFGIDEQGRAFLVMDFINGTSLSDRIANGQSLPFVEALKTITQVCHGLSHAHAQGIVHRDLKPANIVISNEPDGTELVKLVDFGIAKLTYRDDDNRPNLTKTGEVIGTPFYMSPEQCTGTKVDTRSDIYSIGCVLFEVLTGSRPYQGQNARYFDNCLRLINFSYSRHLIIVTLTVVSKQE